MANSYWWCTAERNRRNGAFEGPCGGGRHNVLIAYTTYSFGFDPDDFTEDSMIDYSACGNHTDELIARAMR